MRSKSTPRGMGQMVELLGLLAVVKFLSGPRPDLGRAVVPSASLPVIAEADVVVIGGGTAGVAAAVSAARNGAKTILIERNGFLGGTMTAGGVHIFMFTVGFPGFYREVMDELLRRGGRLPGSRAFDPEVMKDVLYDLVTSAGARVLLLSTATGVVMEGRRILGVVVETPAGAGVVKGRIFVDCTGDGDVAAAAGAPFLLGRWQDGLPQPMTLMYVLKRAGRGRVEGVLSFPMPGGRVLINATRVRGEATDVRQLTEAEIEGRRQVVAQVRRLKRRFPVRLLSTAPHIGVRETRQILGLYILTEEDVALGRRFRDKIARCSYPIDEHNPTGLPGTRLERVKPYDIPYRCLIPRGVDNLLVAGRCISATHIAMSSLRIMPTCMALGQAAGTAAAICVKKGCLPNNLDISELQRLLVEQGCDLGIDPHNVLLYLKSARAFSDSNYPPDEAHPDTGPHLAIDCDERTRWLSGRGPEPHWLIVDLGRPVAFDRIILRFEERYGGVYIVSDYKLQVERNGRWETIASVKGNRRPVVVHKFSPPVRARRVRLYVTKANPRDHIVRLREIEICAPAD